ncbi:hypothetical protein [Stenotrophomonas sp. PD6]|uniref:hypothetical protein n=1 Tax=Stenotrophomonas sp. PD6 TaxID=3368612 RepID=UPI003B9E0640
MTTLSISTAFRRIAAAFGSERAQQKLAQQKSDRATLKLLSVRSINPDNKFRVPSFDSGLAGSTRPSLPEVKAMLTPVSIQPLGTASALEPRQANRPPRDTLDRPPRSAPAQQAARVVPLRRPAPTGAAGITRTPAEGDAQGGWLHNHWKTSPAGVAALSGLADTVDAPTSPATFANVQEGTGNGRTFPGPYRYVTSDMPTGPFRIPRPTLTGKAAGIAAPSAPTGKPTLAARADRVLEHQDVIRTAMRRKAPAIPVAPKAVVPVVTPTVTPPAQKAAPKVIAQPAMATPAPAPPPPPPPPLPPLAPGRVHAASGGLFAELKRHTFATSTSLDENATETFGTGTERTGVAAKRAASDAGRHGISPAKAAAQSLQAELALVMKKRREQLGEKPAKTTIATHRPAVIQPQPNAADRTDALIKPKSVVPGPQSISKELQNRFAQELQRKVNSRVLQRGM